MSFEEVFQTERGVSYNSAAVTDYTQKDSYMQFLLGVHNRRAQVSDMLKEAKFIKQTRAYGSEQMPGEIENNARKLLSQLTVALKTVYGNDAGKIQSFIDSVYAERARLLTLSQESKENSDLVQNLVKERTFDGWQSRQS